MNERLFLNNPSKPARDVSNILYEEVRKHDANRHLMYVLNDDDFRVAAQEWDYFHSCVTDFCTKLPISPSYNRQWLNAWAWCHILGDKFFLTRCSNPTVEYLNLMESQSSAGHKNSSTIKSRVWKALSRTEITLKVVGLEMMPSLPSWSMRKHFFKYGIIKQNKTERHSISARFLVILEMCLFLEMTFY